MSYSLENTTRGNMWGSWFYPFSKLIGLDEAALTLRSDPFPLFGHTETGQMDRSLWKQVTAYHLVCRIDVGGVRFAFRLFLWAKTAWQHCLSLSPPRHVLQIRAKSRSRCGPLPNIKFQLRRDVTLTSSKRCIQGPDGTSFLTGNHVVRVSFEQCPKPLFSLDFDVCHETVESALNIVFLLSPQSFY